MPAIKKSTSQDELPLLKKVVMFAHTTKAAKQGHPNNRLFLVAYTGKDKKGTYHRAWKCEIRADGIYHPAFKMLLKPENLLKGVIEKGRDGSEPTADFNEDSFYTRLTLRDVKSRMASLKALAPPTRPVKTASELRKIAKAKAERIAAVQGNYEPIKAVFNRTELLDSLAERSGLTRRDVSKVYASLVDVIMGSLMPDSVGEFTLPGIAKLTAKKIPAKQGGQKVMSFGVERISKSKPATVRVKCRLLAKVRQVALPL